LRAYDTLPHFIFRTGREAAQKFRVFVTAVMDSWPLKEQKFLTSYVIVFHSLEIPVLEMKLGKEV